MAEVFLDQSQVNSSLKQVGGIGVSEGVDMGPFVDVASPQSSLEGHLDAAWGHRLIDPGPMQASLAWRRKEPQRMAMGLPELPQQLQWALR
jgi:hypothetical protein